MSGLIDRLRRLRGESPNNHEKAHVAHRTLPRVRVIDSNVIIATRGNDHVAINDPHAWQCAMCNVRLLMIIRRLASQAPQPVD